MTPSPGRYVPDDPLDEGKTHSDECRARLEQKGL